MIRAATAYFLCGLMSVQRAEIWAISSNQSYQLWPPLSFKFISPGDALVPGHAAPIKPVPDSPPPPTGRPVAAFPLSVYLSFAPSSLLSLFFPPGSSCRPCSPPPLAVRQTKHQTCIKSIFQKQNIRDYHARRRSTNKRNKASWLFFLSNPPTSTHLLTVCFKAQRAFINREVTNYRR